MPKSPHNYVGLHKDYQETVQELGIVLNPQYESDVLEDELILLQNKTAILGAKLEDSAKNAITQNIKNKYQKEADDMKIYNQEIMDRLK